MKKHTTVSRLLAAGVAGLWITGTTCGGFLSGYLWISYEPLIIKVLSLITSVIAIVSSGLVMDHVLYKFFRGCDNDNN